MVAPNLDKPPAPVQRKLDAQFPIAFGAIQGNLKYKWLLKKNRNQNPFSQRHPSPLHLPGEAGDPAAAAEAVGEDGRQRDRIRPSPRWRGHQRNFPSSRKRGQRQFPSRRNEVKRNQPKWNPPKRSQ